MTTNRLSPQRGVVPVHGVPAGHTDTSEEEYA